MSQSRVGRLTAERRRERIKRVRGLVVTSVLLLAFLIVPIGSPPADTLDTIAQRLTAAGTTRGGAPPDAPAVQLIPVTDAEPGFLPFGQVEIPKLGITMPIRPGVQEDVLDSAVGRWPGLPQDNVVLSGHRTTHLAPFGDLDLLAPADQVHLVYGEGVTQTYEVFDTAIVPEAEYVDYVLGGTPEPDDSIVTLFACHPKGERTHRIVVRARAVAQQEGI